MKEVNEGAMLVAQALDKLKHFREFPEYCGVGWNGDGIDESILLLEQALDKLTEKI